MAVPIIVLSYIWGQQPFRQISTSERVVISGMEHTREIRNMEDRHETRIVRAIAVEGYSWSSSWAAIASLSAGFVVSSPSGVSKDIGFSFVGIPFSRLLPSKGVKGCAIEDWEAIIIGDKCFCNWECSRRRVLVIGTEMRVERLEGGRVENYIWGWDETYGHYIGAGPAELNIRFDHSDSSSYNGDRVHIKGYLPKQTEGCCVGSSWLPGEIVRRRRIR